MFEYQVTFRKVGARNWQTKTFKSETKLTDSQLFDEAKQRVNLWYAYKVKVEFYIQQLINTGIAGTWDLNA